MYHLLSIFSGGPSPSTYLFDTRDGAYREACANIFRAIRISWDPPNCTALQLAIATELQRLVSLGQYDTAVKYWNNYSTYTLKPTDSDYCLYTVGAHTSIPDSQVNVVVGFTPAVLAGPATPHLNPHLPQPSANAIAAPTIPAPPPAWVNPAYAYYGHGGPMATPSLPTPAPSKPTISGATCRKCKVYNEYADADNADGTFVCRSCKVFAGMV